ncbi:hypothetical protein D3C84_1024590 [compost metagenome]
MITWAYANHRTQGTSEDDVACFERLAKLSHLASEPNGCIQRVAQALSSASGADDLTIFGKPHRCASQVKPINALSRATQDKASAGCVVSHGIGKLDIPALDAAADNFKRWKNPTSGGDHICKGCG